MTKSIIKAVANVKIALTLWLSAHPPADTDDDDA